MRTLQCFLKKFKFGFCPQKVEKTNLKSCSEKLKSTFFSLLPAQPKRPKQKNSCSQMWSIDQLYIELGDYPWLSMTKKMPNPCWRYFAATKLILSCHNISEIFYLFWAKLFFMAYNPQLCYFIFEWCNRVNKTKAQFVLCYVFWLAYLGG